MTVHRNIQKRILTSDLIKISAVLLLVFVFSCSKTDSNLTISEEVEEEIAVVEEPVDTSTYILPNIDLSHWKVTLPIGNPTEVKPPEILSYATNETLKPFMYNDSIDGSIVFYTYPGATTTNTSYSRTELREQMVAGSNSTNWTFAEGGRMKGTLSVPEVANDANGNPYRVIVMQIHGRLTNAQRDLIGKSDNNAPPILKIYWQNGKIRVKTKILKDLNADDTEVLYTAAWGDDEGITLPVEVGHDKFTLEVVVTEGKMEVILNETNVLLYDDVHIERWGVFENYFKAGNYLQSVETNSYAKVKYYELEISH